MAKRSHFVRGVYVAGAIMIAIVVAYGVMAALSYGGKCGGYFPGLSVARSCSFLEFASGDALVIAMILGNAFWPLLVGVLLLPPFLGFLWDRRRSKQ